MKGLLMSRLAILLIAVWLAPSGLADHPPLAPFSCSMSTLMNMVPDACRGADGQYPCDLFGIDFARIAGPLGPKTTYEIGEVVTIEGETEHRMFDSSFCAFVPNCDLIPPPDVYEVTEEVEKNICWGVNGTVTAEGKTGLLTKLVGELNVSVEVGGELSGCRVIRERATYTLHIPLCFDTEVWEEYGTATVSGTVTESTGGLVFECNCDLSGWQSFEVYCPPNTQGAGSANTITFTRNRKVNTPCCEDSGPEPCCGCEADG